ncbi:MAG: TIGR01777 family oxidoreductase [Terracidiphilus sp.]
MLASRTYAQAVGPMDPILLSGASGLVGTALRQRLAQESRTLLQLMRIKPRHAGATGPGQVGWNPDAQPAIEDASALEGCAAAIHLGGANLAARRWTEKYRRELVSSRVDSTRALATVLAGLRRPPHTFVVASAVGVYGDRGGETVDEASPPGQGFLADLCRAWEAAAQPARDAGIRVVHLRFGVVLGEGPGALGKMLPIFRWGLGGRLGSGRQWMSWVSMEDAIAAIVFALESPALDGAVNLTAPQPVTNAEYTRALAQALHRPAVLPVPAFALRLALGPMADEALLQSIRALPAKLIAAGFQFKHPRLEDALAAAIGER